MSRALGFHALLVAAVAITLGFLVIPVVGIFVHQSPRELLSSLDDPSARDALWLSLQTTLMALALILLVGTPTAWFLATRRFRGRALVQTLIELPVVLPPAVAGVALLVTLGPKGLLGDVVEDSLVLQTAGVVVALTFVAAPFYIRQAEASFEALDPSWLEASRTLGASEARTFARVAVPTALPGLVSGTALAWGRALGEFGATLVFAGSLQGVTQTAPLAIYDRLADLDAATALAAVLVCVAAALLGSVKLLARD